MPPSTLPAHAALLVLMCLSAACEPDHGSDSFAPPESSGVLTGEPASPAAQAAPPFSLQGGSITRSPSGDRLYVANEDVSSLNVLTLPLTDTSPQIDVALPGPPAQVVATAERVFVTVRDPGLLMVFEADGADGLREVGRVALAGDAWGLALSSDSSLAIVSSAWTATVTGVDLTRLSPSWSLQVAREPRAVVMRPDGDSVYVTHLTSPNLTRIDGLRGSSPQAKVLEVMASPLRTKGALTKAATLSYAATFSPARDKLFLPRQALGAMGIETWNGHATVDVLSTATEAPLASPAKSMNVMWTGDFMRSFDMGAGMFEMHDPWITGPAPTQRDRPFAQARAVVYRASTDTLLIADEGDDVLVELDALNVDPSTKPLHRYDVGAYDDETMHTFCGAPSGVTLSPDESLAYVFCRTTRSVSAVALRRHDGNDPKQGPPDARRLLAKDPLPDDAALGRRLWFNASDSVLSDGYACNACHPEGRDDGHVWHEDEEQSDKGAVRQVRLHAYALERTPEAAKGVPRQTPMLAGRVSAAGPYGWKGSSPSLRHRAMIGFTMHRWFAGWGSDAVKTLARGDALVAFARSGLREPPRDPRPLTEQELRGQRLFADPSVGCATCHDPKTEHTNRGVYDLGPLPRDRRKFDPELADHPGFKVPSLKHVGGTAPYYHDGSVPTLELLIDLNGHRMGHTGQLSPQDRAALIAYLRTL